MVRSYSPEISLWRSRFICLSVLRIILLRNIVPVCLPYSVTFAMPCGSEMGRKVGNVIQMCMYKPSCSPSTLKFQTGTFLSPPPPPLSVSFYLSLCLCLFLSVCLCPSVCLSVCLSVSVSVSVCLSVSLSFFLSLPPLSLPYVYDTCHAIVCMLSTCLFLSVCRSVSRSV